MGCCEAREEQSGNGPVLDANEQAITKGEKLLGFNRCFAKSLCLKFIKHSEGTMLTKNAFILAASETMLNIDGFD